LRPWRPKSHLETSVQFGYEFVNRAPIDAEFNIGFPKVLLKLVPDAEPVFVLRLGWVNLYSDVQVSGQSLTAREFRDAAHQDSKFPILKPKPKEEQCRVAEPGLDDGRNLLVVYGYPNEMVKKIVFRNSYRRRLTQSAKQVIDQGVLDGG
jgi:hypothetical protein